MTSTIQPDCCAICLKTEDMSRKIRLDPPCFFRLVARRKVELPNTGAPCKSLFSADVSGNELFIRKLRQLFLIDLVPENSDAEQAR